MSEVDTVEWRDQPVDPALLELFPRAFALEHRVVPLRREDGALVVAALTPEDRRLARWIRLHAPGPLRLVRMSESGIAAALRACYAATEAGFAVLRAQDLVGRASSGVGPVAVVDDLLAQAVRAGASDIHFEPQGEELRVRWRIDGVLKDVVALSPAQRREVLTRVLVLAGIDIAQRRRLQDGRFRVVVGRQSLDLRASLVPARAGESVVLRILAEHSGFTAPADLGADGPLEARFRAAVAGPDGMTLFAGPTGSGKSTSIDLALGLTRRCDRKVISIEDPVERIKPDRTQIGVRADLGLGFAQILRHALRHDPDVIVVGEIRDAETAEVAFQAALTGHKVLSTLHATGALAAFPRLYALLPDRGLLATALRAVFAQRLVRRRCAACGGAACPTCGFEGYAGRTGVFEILEISAALRRLVRDEAPREALEAQARRDGFRPMQEAGMDKVTHGVTSRIEILRAVGPEA